MNCSYLIACALLLLAHLACSSANEVSNNIDDGDTEEKKLVSIVQGLQELALILRNKTAWTVLANRYRRGQRDELQDALHRVDGQLMELSADVTSLRAFLDDLVKARTAEVTAYVQHDQTKFFAYATKNPFLSAPYRASLPKLYTDKQGPCVSEYMLEIDEVRGLLNTVMLKAQNTTERLMNETNAYWISSLHERPHLDQALVLQFSKELQHYHGAIGHIRVQGNLLPKDLYGERPCVQEAKQEIKKAIDVAGRPG